MAIDVPYSYLVRDGDLAWTCGQVALDRDARVVHPGDLAAQSSVVCDHIAEILARAELPRSGVKRLYLYFVDAAGGAAAEMTAVFSDRFGGEVSLTPIEIPHLYYDGLLLEVDVWWSGGDRFLWSSHNGVVERPSILSEHVLVPRAQAATQLDLPDAGAAIVGGASHSGVVTHAIEVVGPAVTTEVTEDGNVVLVTRRGGGLTWVQGRARGGGGLVTQTEAVMSAFDAHLPSLGLAYADVVKSTTHYVGGSSAEELHENMAVRNRRYTKPGPASTGLPVFGFADPESKVVVDLTLIG